MSSFKLKPSVKVDYDKENDSYIFGHFDETKYKKVTSRAFSCLLGSNPYESVGKTILERFKLTEYQDIDEYWGVRGDMAELLVLDFLKESYKQKGVDIELRTWTKEEVNYDNFSLNEKFGGLLDIAIASPEKYRAVIEVKSKSMKDVDKIKRNRGNIEEVLQGKFLTHLSSVTKCLMIYVFFTPEQEQEIKKYIKEKNESNNKYTTRNFAKMLLLKMDLTPSNMKILVFKHTLALPKEFDDSMNQTYDLLMDFKKTKTIKSSMFSANDLALLKELTFQDSNPF